MNRSELVNSLAELHPQLLIKDADIAVKVILNAMSEALSRGGRIEIRCFGSFDLNYRPPRLGRNPKTGEKIHIAASVKPKFRAGKALKEAVK